MSRVRDSAAESRAEIAELRAGAETKYRTRTALSAQMREHYRKGEMNACRKRIARRDRLNREAADLLRQARKIEAKLGSATQKLS